MRIKERDEWKMAFAIPEWLFEPIVIFFGLMDSLATFQAIMSELLRDLINNTGKMRSLVNNVIVETESKKRHNRLLEEILRRLEENDLYVKSKKCR